MPELRTIRGVELVKTGTWQISTGEWTVTAEDLAAAIEAHKAGVLRRPVIKLGHEGPMRDAAPALGFVDRLRLTDGGKTLVGDLVDVPAAVAKLLPHAYPDRSVEAMRDYQAPDGTQYSLVLTALVCSAPPRPVLTRLSRWPTSASCMGWPPSGLPFPRRSVPQSLARASSRPPPDWTPATGPSRLPRPAGAERNESSTRKDCDMSTPLTNVRVYEPGRDLTAEATAAVTAKTFVAVSGDRGAAGNIAVAPASAGGRVAGVAKDDATTGQLVGVARGGVVKVTAGDDITAFAEVEVGSDATAVPKSSGVAVGYTITGASSGGDAQVSLYH